MTFGEQLKAARKESGKTAISLSANSLMSNAYWNDIERGKSLPPRRSTVVRMVEALGDGHEHLLNTARTEVQDYAGERWARR